MSYSSTELTSKQQSDFANDYPILIGNNVFDQRHLFEGTWGVPASSLDKTDASFPFYNMTGRDATRVSKTTGSDTQHFMNFNTLGEFVRTGASTDLLNPDRVTFPFGSDESIVPGMYILDDCGTAVVGDRILPRFAKVVSVHAGSSSPGAHVLIDKNILKQTGYFTARFFGRPEADKAVFDSVVLLNHNIHNGSGGLGNSINTTVQIRNTDGGTATSITDGDSADNPDSGAITKLTLRSSSDGSAPRLYSGAEYSQIVHYASSGPVTGLSCGLVWAGQRWQLPRWPDKPYHDKGTRSDAIDFFGKSGFSVRRSRWQGQAFRSWSIPLSHSEDVSGCKLFQEGTDLLTQPFILIETPSSDPQVYLMQAEAASISFPKTGKNERVFNITMAEKPPFRSSY